MIVLCGRPSCGNPVELYWHSKPLCSEHWLELARLEDRADENRSKQRAFELEQARMEEVRKREKLLAEQQEREARKLAAIRGQRDLFDSGDSSTTRDCSVVQLSLGQQRQRLWERYCRAKNASMEFFASGWKRAYKGCTVPHSVESRVARNATSSR